VIETKSGMQFKDDAELERFRDNDDFREGFMAGEYAAEAAAFSAEKPPFELIGVIDGTPLYADKGRAYFSGDR
jgi:hypothetical protein